MTYQKNQMLFDVHRSVKIVNDNPTQPNPNNGSDWNEPIPKFMKCLHCNDYIHYQQKVKGQLQIFQSQVIGQQMKEVVGDNV